MKSGDTYRFSLSWPMDTEERILAGELLNKLGNKKSRFLVQLICDYISVHPEVLDPKETIKIIVNSTSVGETLNDMIRRMIQTELADKTVAQPSTTSGVIRKASGNDECIDDMLGNLDIWNNKNNG